MFKKAAAALFVFILLFILVPPAEAQTTPLYPGFFEEPGLNPTRQYQHTHEAEYVDPATGNLHIRHTDIFIPGNGGLDLKVIRHYSTKATGYFASHSESTLSGNGWNIHFGRIRMPLGGHPIGSDPSTVDNPVFETAEGEIKMLARDTGNVFISRDFWRASYSYNINTQEITSWTVTSPSGVVFTLSQPGIGYLEVNNVFTEKTFYTTSITDPNNNRISVEYDSATGMIESVSTTDGRYLEFSYSSANFGIDRYPYLERIKDTSDGNNPRAWEYEYNNYGNDTCCPTQGRISLPRPAKDRFEKFFYLSKVILPSGQQWQYGYTSDDKGTPHPSPTAPLHLNRITYPLGGQVRYEYKDDFVVGNDRLKFGVHKKTADQEPPDANTGIRSFDATWSYCSSYTNNCVDGACLYSSVHYEQGDKNASCANSTLHEGYWHYNIDDALTSNAGYWQIGLLKRKKTYDYDGATPLEEITYDWHNLALSAETYKPAELSAPGYPSEAATYAPVLAKRTILRDAAGSDTAYTTEYFAFDSYGNPQGIRETGPSGEERATLLDYQINDAAWLIKGFVVGEEIYDSVAIDYAQDSGNFGSLITSQTRNFNSAGNLTCESDYTAGISADISCTSSQRIQTRYAYDNDGNISSRTDPNGNITAYSSYYRGTPQTENQPGGVTINRIVSSAGLVTRERDGNGNYTYFSYDKLNRLSAVGTAKANPGSASNTPNYDIVLSHLKAQNGYYNQTLQRGQSGECSNFGGGISACINDNTFFQRLIFNGFGQAICLLREGISTQFRYDTFSRNIFESYPVANTSCTSATGTTFTYDGLGRLKRKIHSDNKQRLYSYAGNGQVTETNERNFNTITRYQTYGTPASGALSEIITPENTTTIDRDILGNINSINQGGIIRDFFYDEHYNLVDIDEPERELVSFCYDKNGNQIIKAVGRNATAPPYTSCSAGSGTTTSTHNLTVYRYDSRNRLVDVDYPSDNGNSADIDFGYDNNDNLVSVDNGFSLWTYSYDENDLLTQEYLQINSFEPLQIDYVYNSLDNLVSIIYPSKRIVRYDPNDLGWAASADPHTTGSITYHANGVFDTLPLASGNTLDTTLDPQRYWLDRIRTQSSGGLDLSYTQDAGGNIIHINDAVSNDDVSNILYDGIDRLTQAQGPWGTLNYSYDDAGNIDSRSLNNNTWFYNYDSRNRLSNIGGAGHYSFQYDTYGNIKDDGLHAYLYNHAGQLRAVDNPAYSYAYDGNNRRVAKGKNGVADTAVVYTLGGQLLGEYDTDGTPIREYIYHGDRIIAQAEETVTVVAPGPLSIDTPAQLPLATPSVAYELSIQVSGGTPYPDGNYNWSLSGALPQGLNFSSATGIISGSPLREESRAFSITVSDSGGASVNRTFTLEVVKFVPLPAISNMSYNGQVPAEGVDPGFILAQAATLQITGLSYGIPALPDPEISVRNINNQQLHYINYNECGIDIGPYDACRNVFLQPGAYILHISDTFARTGGVLASAHNGSPVLTNMSSNSHVVTSGIKPGFILGTIAKVVITAESYGPDPMPNPRVRLLDGNLNYIPNAQTGNCYESDIAAYIGRPLTSPDDCLILNNLSPGSYILDVSDQYGGDGQALISATTFNTSTTTRTITTTSLPDATVDVFYSTTIQASGSGSWGYAGSLPAGLSLSSGGTLSGVPQTAGDFTINVTFSDGSTQTAKSLTLTINPPGNTAPSVTISAPASGNNYSQGDTVYFSAIAEDSEQSSLPAINWNSSRDGYLASGESFSTDTLSLGSHTISASVSDSGGLNDTDTIALTIVTGNSAPNVSISAPANNSEHDQFSDIVFTASATDSQDGNLSNAVLWHSSIDGVLGAGATISTNSLSIGSHTITASVSDSRGLNDSAIRTITVNTTQGPQVSINSPANASSFLLGNLVVFSGSASDVEDGDISADIQWSSSIDGGLGSGRTVSTASLSQGSHTVSATVTDSEGGSDTVSISLTLNAVPLPGCIVEEDFENGTGGWFNSGSSTCTTGSFIAGTPDEVISNGITTQLAGDHSSGSGNAFYSAFNSSPGTNDVDGGVCIIESPAYSVTSDSDLSLWFYHGQRDNGDDASGDFFRLEISENNGSSWQTLIAYGDQARHATWTEANTGVSAGSTVKLRLQVSDGPNAGDLVEAGIDDLSICSNAPDNTAPTVTITTPGNGNTVNQGNTVNFAASAADSEDGNLSATIRWTSNRDGYLGGGATLSTNALSPGTHTIFASISDSGALGATDTVSVVVIAGSSNHSPQLSIISPVDGSSFYVGALLEFSASASDIEDGDISAGILWSSSIDGSLGSGKALVTSSLSQGNHRISATVTDSEGYSSTVSTTLTLNATPVPGCSVEEDFENGAGGWYNSSASTCTTGSFIVGPPDEFISGGITTQLAGDHSNGSGNGNAFYSAFNSSAGTNDVDGGACIVESPTYAVNSGSDLSLWFYHGQRDGADDPSGDFFRLEISENGGSSWQTLVAYGDQARHATWTEANTGVSAGSTVKLRLQVSDGPNTGDLVEAGIDDLSICSNVSENTPPALTITAPGSGSTANQGDTINFTANATDSEDGNLSATINWTSNLDGSIGSGTTLSTGTLSPGIHTIFASVSDSSGLGDTDVVVVTVSANAPRWTILTNRQLPPPVDKNRNAHRPVTDSSQATGNSHVATARPDTIQQWRRQPPMSLETRLAAAYARIENQVEEKITYFYTDALGSPVVATDEQGTILWRDFHRPFGEREHDPIDGDPLDYPIRFTGKPEDSATGLVYLGARYYNPVIGRFYAVDPVGFTGNHHSFNRYTYANNNPYRYVDPNGLSPIDETEIENEAGADWSPGGGFSNRGGGSIGGLHISESAGPFPDANKHPNSPKGVGSGQKGGDFAQPIGLNRASGNHRQLRNSGATDSHHIIQDAAAKQIPGYNRMDAPAVQLKGPSTAKGSEHYNATQVQRQRGGGTYAAERRIGYKALRNAGLSKSEARSHVQRADEYFGGIGVTPNTPMRQVGNRNR